MCEIQNVKRQHTLGIWQPPSLTWNAHSEEREALRRCSGYMDNGPWSPAWPSKPSRGRRWEEKKLELIGVGWVWGVGWGAWGYFPALLPHQAPLDLLKGALIWLPGLFFLKSPRKSCREELTKQSPFDPPSFCPPRNSLRRPSNPPPQPPLLPPTLGSSVRLWPFQSQQHLSLISARQRTLRPGGSDTGRTYETRTWHSLQFNVCRRHVLFEQGENWGPPTLLPSNLPQPRYLSPGPADELQILIEAFGKCSHFVLLCFRGGRVIFQSGWNIHTCPPLVDAPHSRFHLLFFALTCLDPRWSASPWPDLGSY